MLRFDLLYLEMQVGEFASDCVKLALNCLVFLFKFVVFLLKLLFLFLKLFVCGVDGFIIPACLTMSLGLLLKSFLRISKLTLCFFDVPG